MARGRWPRVWHGLLLLPLVGVALWVGLYAQRERDDPAHVLAALRAAVGPALPGEAAVGASARTAPESFDPETLYDFINGAAESFLSNGFERCVATVYTFRSAGGEIEVAAEVYRFASPGGAAAQLAAERPTGAQELADLPGAVADPYTLLAVRGSDYLKLTAMATGPEVEGPLHAVARAWFAEE